MILFFVVMLIVGLYLRFFKKRRNKYADGKSFASNTLRYSSDKVGAGDWLMQCADNPFDYDDFDRGIEDAVHDYKVEHLD